MQHKPKIYPPVWLLFALLAMYALYRWWPVAVLEYAALKLAGTLLLLAGLGCMAWAALSFIKADTPVVPFEPSTVLVTTGPYRFTRNPMYLSMVLLLLGGALLMGAVSALLPVIAFAAIIQRRFIIREEAFLTGIFGDAYPQYCQRVRRWL